MVNEKSNILDSNLLLLTLTIILQFLSLLCMQDNPQLLSLYNPLFLFVFAYGIYLGHKRKVSKNYFLVLIKLIILIVGDVISYILYTAYYAYFISGGDFYTEFNLGTGYQLIALGFTMLVMLPMYMIGLISGFTLSFITWRRAG